MAKRLGSLFSIGLLSSAFSIGAPPDRVRTNISAEHQVTLSGHVRTLPDSYLDEGPVPASQRVDGLKMYFKPSAEQSSALEQLLIDLHNPASARYHQWLTPEQYADQFGINSSDLGKITAWLESQGLHVGYVGRGRSYLTFDGAAAEVEAALRAGIHSYRSPTAVHYANSRDPSVPEALKDVVGAIGGLDDFRPEPVQHESPRFTNNGTHTLAPGDLATIYDFATLLSSGIDGTGQKLAIAGESGLSTPDTDIPAYRSTYNLPAINLQSILVPGLGDPGLNSTVSEAVLDIELAGGVAPNAAIVYVYSPHTYDAVTYAIDQALAPVVSGSYTFAGGCDASVSTSMLSTFQSLAQQGNAQGITWVNSSGDAGPAGCDANGVAVSQKGLASRFPGDIPEVTAVGGTTFNEQNGNYWSASNGAFGGSALGYIPEVVWNDTSPARISASGGGVSAFFRKPYWQTGPGVPDDGQRDVPDLAFAASAAHDPYNVFYLGSLGANGGTSAAAPVFSGIVTLLNHYLAKNGAPGKPGLGNLNILLYRLAQSSPSAFHDITSGNNIVPCAAGAPGCANGQMGFTAGPGYDLATGIGSVDVANLAPAVLHAGSGPLLTITSSHGSFTQGQSNAAYTITVTNLGYGSTSGAVTVTDVLPTGLTLSSMAGTGWTCSITCTRSDALAVAMSYPVITVTVGVAANAPSSVTNMVTVSGGGSPAANANDITAIAPAPPPGAVTIFSPVQGATGVSVTPTLTWTAATGATSYDVYFGTAQMPPFATNTTGTSYTPTTLPANTTYYWYLVSKNASGSKPSAVWSFTTGAAPLPAPVTTFSPAQGAMSVSLTPTLTWTAATGATSYDVYFGTVQTPPLATNTTGTSYTPAALTANTTYYWYLVSKNATGSTPSAVWSFTTAVSSHSAFFSGEVSLGAGVYYLQFSDSNVFGYYNYVASSIFYHYEMGYEAFVPGSASDIYLYDFTSSHWFYTSSTLFPYLYDFTLNNWLYYFPDTKNAGHYTANPRYFSNLTTGKIFTM